MNKRSQMKAQMYSLRELPQNLRVDFALPGNPYSQANQKALEYLKSLGVFFYRDEFHPVGIIIEPEIGGTPMIDRERFEGFLSSCILTDPKTLKSNATLTVQSWGKPTPSLARKVREYINKHGDDRAWLFFNKPVTIIKVEDSAIHTI